MSSMVRKMRIVAINDVYELGNLPKLQKFISNLSPLPNAVLLAGDFVSPSTLSSIDSGKGAIAVLRAAGITHACLGNHEADLKLAVLKKRVEEFSPVTVINSNMRSPPNEVLDSSWLGSPLTPPHAIIMTPCKSVKVALLGIMSDEDNMYRAGTFRGVPISNVLDTFDSSYRSLVPTAADFMIPMTHQSIRRDRELAKHMLNAPKFGSGIVIGGHEHEIMDEVLRSETSDGFVRILKTGHNAQHASLIDLTFDISKQPPSLTDIDTSFVDITEFDDSVVVKKIADRHLSAISKMENEIIIDESMVPADIILSSEEPRKSQTTVGAFFCQAIKEELEVDVALINGATIKGRTTYSDNKMSYAQLKKELPFPTKIVVIEMTRVDLLDSIDYSRKNDSEGNKVDTMVPKRGYLQVDFDLDASGYYTGNTSDVLRVALPRNLLGGFCKIRPLMDVASRLKKKNRYPEENDFIPALNLVTRYCCKLRW